MRLPGVAAPGSDGLVGGGVEVGRARPDLLGGSAHQIMSPFRSKEPRDPLPNSYGAAGASG